MNPVKIIDILFIGIFSMYKKADDSFHEPKISSVALLSNIIFVNLFILDNLCERIFNNSLSIFIEKYNINFLFAVAIIVQSLIVLIVYFNYIRNSRYRILYHIFIKFDEERQKRIKRYIAIYLTILVLLFLYSFSWIKPLRFHKENSQKRFFPNIIQKESSQQNSIRLLSKPLFNKGDTLIK